MHLSADHSDIGKLVNVSNDDESFQTKQLARIAKVGDSHLFVCWDDEDDPCKCSSYAYARKLDPYDDGNEITIEKLFVLQKMKIDDANDVVSVLKEGQDEIEKQIQREWREKGIKKQEIRIGNRSVSMTMNVKIYCNVYKEHRQRLAEYVKEHGLEFLLASGVDTDKIKSWMTDNAIQNEDGSFDLSFMPEEMTSGMNVYQCGRMSLRNVGLKG